MDLNAGVVKGRRRYDSSRRRQQALQSRAAVLEAAKHLFLTEGYPATTVASIAQAAQVSVEMIYKAFGGKAGLVRTIVEQSLGGTGSTPAWRRSDEMQALETNPRVVIERWGLLLTEVAPVAAPIHILIKTAAATDPEMSTLLEEVEAARLTRMEHNARTLQHRGQLRNGVTLEIARDVLWVYSSSDLYQLLVLRQGWSLERYGRFATEGMIAALLPSRSSV